ncbi:unnamed protein product [Caenorhabditis sp. 36 PRJEB53466]|nr:unnamed protein product [Caenorhabditis sp. 36 PRJEB53466]
MDVETYFPANISAVPNDENEETVTTATSDEERGTIGSAGRRLMTARQKRFDPPLLSTILEVPSTTSILPADTSILCLLCLRKISGAIPNFVKPCQCLLVFVHTTCAIDNDSFFGGTCTQCHTKYRPEQSIPRQSLSPTKSSTKKMSATKKPPPSDDSTCVLCHNQKYRNPDWPQKCDAKLIRPCFCGFLAHHGCMIELLKAEKACQWCGVKYRYFKYGSFGDFCRRYSIQHVCYVLLFAFLLFFFVLAFRGSVIFRPAVSFTPITLTVLAVFFLVIFVGACLFTIKHTVKTRLPRFRIRYGKVTVVPYDPDVRSKKEALKSLNAARSYPIDEFDVPLNPVADVENVESNVEGTRTDPSDLSLGQHMFGIAANSRMCSSTPVIQKPKKTVFDSSEA